MIRAVPLLLLLLVACTAFSGRVDAPMAEEVEAELIEVGTNLFADMIAEKARLEDLAYRLNLAARSYCGSLQRPLPGVLVGGHDAIEKGWLKEAGRRQGLGDLLTVLHVVPGGPFARAGAQPGDQIVLLGTDAPRRRSEFVRWMLAAADLERVDVTIRREGREMVLAVVLDRGCPVPFELSAERSLLPHGGDGPLVVATRGLLEYAKDDDRLAVPLSHQLAHVILDRGEGDALARERMADAVGVRIAAVAGYDPSQTIPYWEDVARAYPWIITPERARGDRKDRFRRLLAQWMYEHHDLARRMEGMSSVVGEVQQLLDEHRQRTSTP